MNIKDCTNYKDIIFEIMMHITNCEFHIENECELDYWEKILVAVSNYKVDDDVNIETEKDKEILDIITESGKPENEDKDIDWKAMVDNVKRNKNKDNGGWDYTLKKGIEYFLIKNIRTGDIWIDNRRHANEIKWWPHIKFRAIA